MQTLAPEAAETAVRYLAPGELIAERLPSGGLRVTLGEAESHDYVRAYRALPFSQPSRYISLRVGKSAEREIGVVRDLADLHPVARALIEEELAKRYLVHVVTRIHRVAEELGFLYWDVETDRGRRQLTTPRWRQSHVTEVGSEGNARLILDVFLNRYLIPDLEALDAGSRKLFLRFIYW